MQRLIDVEPAAGLGDRRLRYPSPSREGAPAEGFAVRWVRAVAAAACDNALILTAAAAYLVLWSAAAPWLLAADSWMTFNDGREIARTGIPHEISMTVLGHGAAWVDQQWLASLAYWSLYRVGGSALTLVVTLVLLLAPLLVAAAFARRRGAGVTTVIPFLVVPFLNFSSILRAQVFSSILLVVVVAVLAGESRRRSWHAFALLPVLVLWANLHGAVLIGAALVSLLGITEIPGAWRARARAALLRASALLVLPPLCLMATPYGLATLSYYRQTIDNPALKSFEKEWQAPTLVSLAGLPLFLVAGATLVLVGKRRRDLTAFELGSLALTLVAALMAGRSIPWFGYTALMLVPPLAQRARRKPTAAPMPRRVTRVVAVASVAVSICALGYVAIRPSARLEAAWPTGATTTVSTILDRDPNARVFASYEYADWILFRDPAARGRVAFNGHLELLTRRQLESVVHFLGESSAEWQAAARGYRVFVLNPWTEQPLIDDLRRDTKAQVVYKDALVTVLDRGARKPSWR